MLETAPRSEPAGPGLAPGATRVLTVSTVGFTVFFAVWVMFAIVGLPLRKELGLNDSQFALLAAIPILTGSILRVPFGILTDRFGGRVVFTSLLLATAIPTYLVSRADTYGELLFYAFFVGMAGISFAVGIAWVSAWYPRERQGVALGTFGAGNVGASITKLAAPSLVGLVAAGGALGGVVPGGWRFVPFLYSILLVLMAAAMWIVAPSPDHRPGHGRALADLTRPLRFVRVWRFGLYYIVVFGAYVALSLWLPKYYVDVFGLDLKVAGLLTALFIFPASLLRPVGGHLSDRYGARRVMYWVFGLLTVATAALCAPNGHITLYLPQSIEPDGIREVMEFRMGPGLFTVLVFLVGVAMGVGKAAVYKHIPEYFPNDVGAVGGLVGAVGGLGGFFLPLLFAWAQRVTGLPQSTFFVLLAFTLFSFVWMHLVVQRMMRQAAPQMAQHFEHPEVAR
jgi:NNP family nitrate/nitrite transporter-like MFS transporter